MKGLYNVEKTDIGIKMCIKEDYVPKVRLLLQKNKWYATHLYPHWNINMADFEYYVSDDKVAILNAIDSTLLLCSMQTIHRKLS